MMATSSVFELGVEESESLVVGGRRLVLPAFFPFITWLRMSFLDLASILSFSTNWNAISKVLQMS